MKKLIFSFLFIVLFSGAYAQGINTKLTLRLPNSTSFKEYQVKKYGENYILNGDIIVGKASNGKQNIMAQRPVEGGWSYIWPKGYIPVEMEDSIRQMGFENTVIAAIETLNATTNLRFRPRTKEKDYVFINYMTVDEMGFSGGNSWVGRQGGRQDLNLSTVSISLVMHELLHAVGFYHEQSRHDRDNHIDILWDNIKEDAKFNYLIEPSIAHGEYNYTSIMHYFPTAFGINGATTMRCKFGNFISNCAMGGNGLNAKDIADINASYFFNAQIDRLDFSEMLAVIEANKLLLGQKAKLNMGDIYTKELGNGMYKIKINHTGKYLAIEGKSKDNGARLVQWDFVDQLNHKFYVKAIGNGFYVISAAHSGRFINAEGQSKADGTPIIQWDYANQDNVKWRIFYSSQLGTPGWVIENMGSSPIRLAAGITIGKNGEPFILMLPQRQDANNYEPYQTFSFEKIGELPMSETGIYKNSPHMLPKVKKR